MKKLLVLAPLLFLPLYANSMSKEDFINRLSSSMKAKFCDANWYYRQCYNISAQTCQSVAASAVNTCVRQNNSQIPNIINQQNNQKVAGILGSCAGRTFDSKLRNKQNRKNKKCQNPNNWK